MATGSVPDGSRRTPDSATALPGGLLTMRKPECREANGPHYHRFGIGRQDKGGSVARNCVDGRSLRGALMSICGLDFGTSNTTLGTMVGNVPDLAALEAGHTTIPSAIFYETGGTVRIGRKAIESYVEG